MNNSIDDIDNTDISEIRSPDESIVDTLIPNLSSSSSSSGGDNDDVIDPDIRKAMANSLNTWNADNAANEMFQTKHERATQLKLEQILYDQFQEKKQLTKVTMEQNIQKDHIRGARMKIFTNTFYRYFRFHPYTDDDRLVILQAIDDFCTLKNDYIHLNSKLYDEFTSFLFLSISRLGEKTVNDIQIKLHII